MEFVPERRPLNLTPTIIPYFANRGGPMVGLEALSMQGITVN